MPLPTRVLDFLNESAANARVPPPGVNDDLFNAGVLDSFALIDFVSLIEQVCGITIPDQDINAPNFQSVEAIERYVEARKV